MKYYIDIKLLGDTEITLGFIWQKVYSEVHLALVRQKDNDEMIGLGLSLPNYNQSFPLGDTIRLFAQTKEELTALKIEERLKKFVDYLNIESIKEVPNDIKTYVTFSRKRFKSNAEIRRLAKRYAKRNNISEEEALAEYTLTEEKYTKLKEKNKLPFINIKSTSTNQFLKVFIEKKEMDKEEIGKFNTFGLSKTSTVPWF